MRRFAPKFPTVRLWLLTALLALPSAVQAGEDACAPATGDAAACQQQRAERALGVLSERYARVWAQLPAERRSAFAAAERRWLNGGRWDDHAACISAHAATAPAEIVAARCLADVTLAHLEALNGAYAVRVAAPHN